MCGFHSLCYTSIHFKPQIVIDKGNMDPDIYTNSGQCIMELLEYYIPILIIIYYIAGIGILVPLTTK